MIYLYLFFLWVTPLVFAETAGQSAGKNLSLEEALKGMDAFRADANAEFQWDPFFQSGIFSASGHSVVFHAGTPGEPGIAIIDGKEILNIPSPYIEKGILMFPEAFLTSVKQVLIPRMQEDYAPFRIAAIIVDPGHGGKDTGAIGTHRINGKTLRVVEKDITLKVSQGLHTRLVQGFPDKRVILTRKDDTYPSLENRVANANSVPLKDNEAIIFVSIHANASFNKTARGYEIWYLSPEIRRTVIDTNKYDEPEDVMAIHNAMLEEEFTTESIIIARSILKRFDETIGKSIPSRGIKPEEWFVVRNTRMPAVLVELGFVTNEADALFMTDDEYLKNFSEALYKGIKDFITLFEQTGGFIAIE
ncbi:MAG: N-acetylmuramoyl-L-alanine amidase [Treponema sp.]|jgi:N-acetylmuramoyl-L-alanine amidase|nr:N-acetylmuramoyl-L-alanine amidase [Treponema sp.]